MPYQMTYNYREPSYELNTLKYFMEAGSSIPIFGGGIIGQGFHFAHLQV